MSYAQKTSLTIDNQYPGWLSYQIPYGDQVTVQYLTVTGYLNGTDVDFLRELLFSRNVKHLDLTDANIVAGGNYCPQDSVLGFGVFYNDRRDSIEYLALPSSLKEINKSYNNNSSKGVCNPCDTLIIGGSLPVIPEGLIREHSGSGFINKCPNYL